MPQILCGGAEPGRLTPNAASLRVLRTGLKPRGSFPIALACPEWLWIWRDLAHHHRRRYRAADPRPIAQTGLGVLYLSHFNFIFFPMVAALRLVRRLVARDQLAGPSLCAAATPHCAGPLAAARGSASESCLFNRIGVAFGASPLMLARPSPCACPTLTAAANRAH